ncbi:MAG: DNA/RNA non-specific endonuclease [Bacteroidaceae bacterium]
MRKSQKKRILAILGMFVVVGVYHYLNNRVPEVKSGVERTETDSTIVENSVQVSQDSAGNKVYENVRRVTYKNARAKGLEIPAYLTDRDEEIVQHEGFTLSYNKKHLLPNWVAWLLTRERTKGTEKRADNFQPDESVKKGPVAVDADYRGSGYDRGHMCPAADCKHNRQSMNECFLLTNICPQTHNLNAGDWKELETKTRQWAQRYDSIYVVCGPVLQKGRRYHKVGENQVTVPEKFFKVLLRFTAPDQAQAIGFIYDNDEDTNHPLEYYAVTVDSVEALTGINFFSKLEKRVERKAESQYDMKWWK